jgi:NNP family nitrate/nitrite transporter-like MFS transporter
VTVTVSAQSAGEKPGAASRRQPLIMLGLATLGFALNFWAWALLSPLGAHFKETLALSGSTQALLVAVPVVVGSLGRIPVGALTDRYGGRVMFPAVTFTTVVPVLFIGYFGYRSYAALIIGGFFLGVAGTAFAVGVPFVNEWFPPERRGFAIGIFGAGMGGTAISALTTVKLVEHSNIHTPFLITAIVLAVYGVVAAIVLRDLPDRVVPTESAVHRLASTTKLAITWQAAALYAVGFGGYVAFSVYLPTYLKTAYELTQDDAATKMAGFVVVAVVMRPIGGWLSDRFAATRILAVVFAVVGAFAVVQSTQPSLKPLGTIAFLTMAAGLGTASGAVFALVAQRAPANRVGAVTGFVGAAGGLGGFIPPLLMGSIHDWTGSYAGGLIALAVVAALVSAFAVFGVRRTAAPVS